MAAQAHPRIGWSVKARATFNLELARPVGRKGKSHAKHILLQTSAAMVATMIHRTRSAAMGFAMPAAEMGRSHAQNPLERSAAMVAAAGQQLKNVTEFVLNVAF